jgi:hypothetical protein
MHPKQPEHPRGRVAELLAGPGEHGARIRRRVPGAQRVQPGPGVAQRAGGGDGQRQRQPRAQFSQLRHRRRLGHHPPRAQAAGQQLPCFRLSQHVEGEQARAVGRGQPGELIPAGNQHQAARAARQQRPDLRSITGIVQHDEHPPPGQQAAVQRRLTIQVRRDPLGRHL